MGKRFTTEEFIEKAIEIHGDLYEYDRVKYVNSKTKVEIFCKACQVYFFQTSGHHLDKCGCKKCGYDKQARSRSKTKEQFIEDAIKVHGNRYDYSPVEYINNTTNVKILCEKHGLFPQIPSSHIIGQGCPQCALIGRGAGFSRSGYIKHANGRICTFYTLRCFNNEEEFYKIGRTMNSIKSRYSGIVDMPYEYEIISEVKGSAGFIFDLERDEKRKLKELHYLPKIQFGGSLTECFTDYKI
jgi:hypothetical protein